MNTHEHNKMEQLQQRHWWYLGRRLIARRVLHTYLKLPGAQHFIVDIGCGAGEGIEVLGPEIKLVGIDPNELAIPSVLARGYRLAHQATAERLPFPGKLFGGALMLDVLEHIEDDQRALVECARVLKASGFLLLTVPAYSWLWSRHDEALDHKRRYAKKKLVSQIEKAGFEVRFASYFGTFLFPAFIGYRLLFSKRRAEIVSDALVLPRAFNFLFLLVYKLESVLLSYGARFPFGSSIIVLARKAAVEEAEGRRL